MKKGISVVHYLIFLVILLMFGIGYMFTNAFREVTTIEKGLKERAVLEAMNAMDLLKKNLQQSLKYSYYQASYEISKYGGGDLKVESWRNYDDVSKFPSDFKQHLSSRTRVLMNMYSEALAESGITTVDYTEVAVTQDQSAEKISAVSKDDKDKNKKLEVSKIFYSLSDESSIFVVAPTKTLTLFEMGKVEFVDKDPIKIAVEEAERSIENQCRQIVVATCENEPVDCRKELDDSDACSNLENEFKEKIRDGIASLGKNENDISTSIEISEIATKAEPTSNVVYGDQDSSCGCKKQTEKTEDVPCTDDPQKKCTKTTFVCEEYYRKSTVTCSFKYVGSAKARVAVTDLGHKYPVYGSSVNMRNIQLNFDVISGNDYTNKLIQTS